MNNFIEIVIEENQVLRLYPEHNVIHLTADEWFALIGPINRELVNLTKSG